MTTSEASSSTRTLLIGIWHHLSHRRRVQLGLLLLVMIASGLAELLSLGAIIPFLAALSDPAQFWDDPFGRLIAQFLHLRSPQELLLPSILLFTSAAITTSSIRLLNLWINGQLAAAIGADLSSEAYRRTLYQPYITHVRSNSSKIITSTMIHIAGTVDALNASLLLVNSSVVAGGILLGLIIVDAPMAFAAAFIFGTAYIALGLYARSKLRTNGKLIANASTQQLKALQEGLLAIRDVLLDGTQSEYLKIYQQADRPKRHLEAKNIFIGSFPRFAFEALGMVGIAVIGGFLVFQRGTSTAVIPLLGVLALGAQRLLPALQQIYGGWASLRAYNAAITEVLYMLNQPLPKLYTSQTPLPIRHSIRLSNVSYSYDDGHSILDNINLEILRGESIGLIGPTGSGKSTLVDLLMGLLTPTSGHLYVDDYDIHDLSSPERIGSWQACIAHVPQTIYLSDSTIADNIAFGSPPHLLDIKRVKEAAALAQIDSFIQATPLGYNTLVGERGVRLSGGQRQRIGIARALYKKSSVLVLDEATSALDSSTETDVMRAIDNLGSELTIIMIAHRLSTLRNCDRIIKLENGNAFAA